MENCEFVEKCPIFGRFKHEGAKNIWLQVPLPQSARRSLPEKETQKGREEPSRDPLDHASQRLDPGRGRLFR